MTGVKKVSKGTHHKLPFRPRARILQLLGDQLIGTPRLAVFELVKNAYDADALSVTVTLHGLDSEEPEIVVQDDGEGMTLETIQNIWLVPAHDHREQQRLVGRRTRLGRLPLGEKGVGRFAVHKLGDKIELVTRAKASQECVVAIDWSELTNKPYLSDAKVSIRTRDPEVFRGTKTGTRIKISDLREASWSRGEVRRLLRQITSISSPFGDRPREFSATLEVPDHPEWVSDVPDVDSLLSRAPWRFDFKFDQGVLSWNYAFRGVTGFKLEPRKAAEKHSVLLIAPERDVDTFGLSQAKKSGRAKRIAADKDFSKGLGPIKGTFFVFDRDREVLSKVPGSQLLESFLDESGGVRVYRDGIRIYNYGEPGDDWLGLDLRRVNTPTRNISRNIILGAVDLSLEKSTSLREKTNREGFVENDAYRRLRQIVLGALSVLEVERKIDKDKLRSLTGGGSDPEVDRIAQPLQALRRAAKKHKLSKELDPLIDRAETNYNEMRDTMLRAGLSGVGLAIVFHEIEQGVRVLYGAIAAQGKSSGVLEQAHELVRMLDGFTELLRKGDSKEHSLKHLIRRVRDINRVRFRGHNVSLICPALEDDAPDCIAHFSFGLVLGALNNILDNAFYWLRVRWPDGQDKGMRKIFINIEKRDTGECAVVIADSGPGFQDSPDRLTRPFFSRRPEGMGVGLYYANMVMELNGGQLEFPESGDVGAPKEVDGAAISLFFGKEVQKS